MPQASSIVKKWLFQVDLLECYVLCFECFWKVGDQFISFSRENLTPEQKLEVQKQSREYFQSAEQCDCCKTVLTKDYSGMHNTCPMQGDNCKGYYPGGYDRWQECNEVYAMWQGGASNSKDHGL